MPSKGHGRLDPISGLSLDPALLAFALSLLAAHRGGPQLLVGHLSDRLGRSTGLLAVALLTALATSAMAAFAGAWMSAQMIGLYRAGLVSGALILAGGLLAFRRLDRLPDEPTRSFGAIALALTARQALDPSRLVIFASAAALASPWHALAGGGLATSLSMILGWALAERVARTTNWRCLHFATIAVIWLLAGLIAWVGYTDNP